MDEEEEEKEEEYGLKAHN